MAKKTNAKVYTQEKIYLITNPRFPDEPYMEHKPDDNDFAHFDADHTIIKRVMEKIGASKERILCQKSSGSLAQSSGSAF